MVEEVRLGLMPPLSGLVGLYGQEISWAAQIACEEINEAGGVLGRSLRIIIEDDGSLPETAVPAANKLINEHQCIAIIGNLLSNSRIAVANNVAEPRKIPYLNFSFYEGSIYSRYFFHFAALPNQQIDHMIPYMAKHFGPKMFFVGNNYEWPRGSIDAAKRALLKAGGEVVGERYFPIDQEDFVGLLNEVARSGADVFVPYAAGRGQQCLLAQFTEMGLKSRMAVVMGHYDEAMVGLMQPEVREGFYSSNTYFMSVDTPTNRAYLERLSLMAGVSGIWPNGNGVLTNFGDGAYACVHAFAKAVNQAGSLDIEAIVDALENVVVEAPQGKLIMDPRTHHAYVNTYLSRCTATGEFELIENFGLNRPEIPVRYQGILPESNYDKQDGVADNNKGNRELLAIGVFDVSENIMLSFAPEYAGHEVLKEKLRQITAVDRPALEQAVRSGLSVNLSDEVILAGNARLSVIAVPLNSEQGRPCVAFYLTRPKQSFKHETAKAETKQETAIQVDLPVTSTLVITIDKNNKVEHMNRVASGVWGIKDSAEIIGHDAAELFDHVSGAESILDGHDGQMFWSCHCKIERADGASYNLTLSVESRVLASGETEGLLITGRMTDGDAKYIKNDSELFLRADMAIVATNESGTIVQANNAACRMFGYSRGEMLGMSVHHLLPPHLRKKHHAYFDQYMQSEKNDLLMGERGEITGYRKDGTFFPAEASLSKYVSANGVSVIATLRDITERKKEKEELLWHATHDPLTRLPNRTLIRDRLVNALNRSRRNESVVMLMFVDLDEFKMINDTYGHKIGDQALVTTAERLMDIVRPGDTVARFGGDEFLVLCDQIENMEIIAELAERIMVAVKQPLEIDDMTFYPTASIGIAVGNGKFETADEMLRNADAAMYVVKQHGRDGWKLFDQEVGDNVRAHLQIANGLREAIDKDEFEIYYQPIIEIVTQKIVGAEALLRWSYKGSHVAPSLFIPVSEITGSILVIGEWVMAKASKEQAIWRQALGDKHAAPYVSINLSARQVIKPGLADDIVRIMKEAKVSPSDIVLEITETTLMSDVETSQRVMHQLGDRGLAFAIDDFGTGHSSLGRIKSLPVGLIKIDQVFVKEIERDESNKAIATAIINMAHALGLTVTAEGVEKIEQFEILKQLGCNNVQGHLFDRPLPAEEFLKVLKNNINGYQLDHLKQVAAP